MARYARLQFASDPGAFQVKGGGGGERERAIKLTPELFATPESQQFKMDASNRIFITWG